MNATDNLIGGVKYTFTFQSDGFGNVTDSSLTARVTSRNLPIDAVSVSRPIGSSAVYVVFTMKPGAQWTVLSMAQNLEAALSNGLGNYTYQQSSTGDKSKFPIPPELIFAALGILIVITFSSAFGRRVAERVVS